MNNSKPRLVPRLNDMFCLRTRFPARIDDNTFELFVEIAKEQNVSINRLLNDVLEDYVDNYTKK